MLLLGGAINRVCCILGAMHACACPALAFIPCVTLLLEVRRAIQSVLSWACTLFSTWPRRCLQGLHHFPKAVCRPPQDH